MNVQKSLIALSISLLISLSALNAAPFVYVANANSSSFSVIDQATGNPIAGSPFAVPNSANLEGVAISPDNQTAYMIDVNNKTLIAINTATNSIVSTTSLPNNGGHQIPSTIAISGTTAYIGMSNSGGSPTDLLPVTITNPSAPVVGTEIQIQATDANLVSIGDIVISNNVAYLTVFAPIAPASYIAAVDLSSSGVTQTNLSPSSSPTGIAIDTNTNIAYVVLAGPTTVQAFQLPAVTLVGSPIPVGLNPFGIVISPDHHYAYVANTVAQTVSVIDLTLPSPSVVATISGVGNQELSTENIAISADNTMLYVATGFIGSNTVTPITVATRIVGTPIPVGGIAFALAVTSSGSAGPTNVVGVRTNNVFLLQTARYVTITWTASTSPMVTSYNIYNGTALIGTVPATSPLTFNAFIPVGDDGNNLFVSAVSTLGGESALTPVVVA